MFDTPIGAVGMIVVMSAGLLTPWVAIPAFSFRGSLDYFDLIVNLDKISRFSGTESNALYIPLISLLCAGCALFCARVRALLLGLTGLIGLIGSLWVYALLCSSVSILGIHLNLSGMLDWGFWIYAIASAAGFLCMALIGGRGWYFLITAAVLISDQVSKHFVITVLGLEHSEIVAIPGVLSFHVIKNTGAAFGIFQSLGPMLAIVTVIMIMLGFLLVRTERDPCLLIPLSLVLGGAVGNLLDRILRIGVIDFIEIFSSLISFPLFNLADIAIAVGTIGIVFYGLSARQYDDVSTDCDAEIHASDST